MALSTEDPWSAMDLTMVYINTSQYTTGPWGQGMNGDGKVQMKEVTTGGYLEFIHARRCMLHSPQIYLPI